MVRLPSLAGCIIPVGAASGREPALAGALAAEGRSYNELSYFSMIATLAVALLLGGCEQSTITAQPEELQAGTACSLDGMLLLDYPGPKAQIHYASGETEFFCDTTEMFAMLLQPEQHRKVTAAYTQDMGAAEWRKPTGHWIDARSGFYVKDSKLMGSMGPTFASFANQGDAEAFIKEHGGKLYRYDDITPEMSDLRGGAHHDHNM